MAGKLKKEQAPDARMDITGEVSKIGLDNPEYHYRIVGKDAALKNFNRIGRHKSMGYELVAEDDVKAVMAVKKDVFEARHQARMNEANSRLASVGKKDADQVLNTMEYVRGSSLDED